MKYSKELGKAYIACEGCKQEMPYIQVNRKLYCCKCGHEHKKEFMLLMVSNTINSKKKDVV